MNQILFADDSNLITSGTSLHELETKINIEIPKLVNWLQTNRLSLNIKKTHIMIFGKKKRGDPLHINIKIEGEKLDIVQSTKFLGLILDHELNWKLHIAYLTQKIAKSVGIISRARQLLNADILRQLYYSFLYPYLNYCTIIWGLAATTTLAPLFRLQKRAIRLICNIKRRDSTIKAFQNLKILRLPDIYTLTVLSFMYNYKNGKLPHTFNDFYTENNEYHRYPTRGANQLRIPLAKSKIASTFVRKTGVALWNSLSPLLELESVNNIKSFKQKVIALLISKY